MPALRIVVGPVDNPAFFIPDTLAVEADAVADRKSIDSRSNVDVVCYQQRWHGCKFADDWWR